MRGKILWLGILVAAMVAVPLLETAGAKDYAVDAVRVDARVHEDGSLDIHEEISYRFSGRFRFAYRVIPILDRITVSEVEVEEAGVLYGESTSESPGTFSVTRRNGELRITWYYEARDEARTFKISYKVAGAVKRHGDTAELYYQFVGSGWSHPIGTASVAVQLPGRVPPSDIKVWAHGPLYGVIRIAGESRVAMEVSPLPAHTFWEGRILFPPDFVPNAPASGRGSQVAAIVAEENGLAARSDRQREEYEERVAAYHEERAHKQERARRLLPVSIALALLSIGVWVVLFRQHGLPHSVMLRSVRGEIPSDHSPAIVAYLMNRSPGGTAIVATLLDLAERGYLEIRESVEEKRSFFGSKQETDYRFERTSKPLSEVSEYERNLVEFMMSATEERTGFTMSALKKAARKKRTTFRKWFQSWAKMVKQAAGEHDFFEPWPTGPIVVNILVGLAVAAAGLWMTVSTDSPVGVPALLAGTIMAALSVALNRRTVEGQRLHAAYKGFRNHLKSISRAMGPTTLSSSEWARYLAIAVVFGMHKKLLPQIEMTHTAGHSAFPAWYVASMGHGSGVDGLSSLAGGLTAMVNSVTTTVSSSTGAGGGASSGGGGGAGGGGGGAG